MSSPNTLQKFELLQRIFQLSQEQTRALEDDQIERFAGLMTERERLIGELLAMGAPQDGLPANVIPFPRVYPAEDGGAATRAASDDDVALASVIRGILFLDERNERLLKEKMDQVREALQEVSRGRSAARGYRSSTDLQRITVDRAG